MPYVKTTPIVEDDIPTASQLNGPYNDLATASASIDTDNVASGAITFNHLDANFNALYQYEDSNSTNLTAINSTSYVTLDRGGTPTEITFGPGGLPIPQYQPLRISGTGLVTNTSIVTIWDFVNGNGKPNLYAFQLLISYNISGGATQTVSAGEWGYSFGTASSTDRYSTLNTNLPSCSIPICYQTFQFETVYRPSVANFNIEKIELQAKVYDNTNTLRISRNAIHAIVGWR